MNYSQRVLFMLLIGLARIAAECPGGIPVFGSLTQAIPSLRNMPGMNFIPDNKGINFGPENKNLNSAIEQVFTYFSIGIHVKWACNPLQYQKFFVNNFVIKFFLVFPASCAFCLWWTTNSIRHRSINFIDTKFIGEHSRCWKCRY